MVMPPATLSAPGATMVPPSIRTLPALMKRPTLAGPEMVRVFVRTSLRVPRSMLSPAAGTVIVQSAAIVQAPAPGAHSCVPPHWARAGADQVIEPSRTTTRARRRLMGCGGTPGGSSLARNFFAGSAGRRVARTRQPRRPSGAEAIGSGRDAELGAEGPDEVRQIVEADVEGDVRDRRAAAREAPCGVAQARAAAT